MTDEVILYFEDDPLSREVMKVCLTRGMGYHNVWIFEDSADFENRLNSAGMKPDIIFLDIHMEPIDGFAMLKLVRQSETYQSTKVIALTASVMNEEVTILREAGFDGVIAKP
ncbi:MAG: response regulator, partial [Chloroflexi bacterium]